MIEPKASFPVRLWRGIWRTISFVRASLANVVFLLFFIIFVSALMGNRSKAIPAAAPLFIAPSGPLVDQESYADPMSLLLGGNKSRDSQTNLRELISVIDAAATDPRITALVMQLDYLADSGSAKTAELADAVLRFKANQKPVIAYADYYSQQQYFLAAHADEIYINDMGGVMLTGLGLYRNYYKTALDKLSIKFHIFKVGTFKDFVEPYTRDTMSDASKQHNSEWMSELWGLYTNRVETQRKLATGTIDTLINTASQSLLAAGNSTAQMALNAKLVDHLGTRVSRMERLIQRFGADPDISTQFFHVSYQHYKQEIAKTRQGEGKGNIGLIVASGAITDGEQPEGSIGGDTLAHLLRKAREDKDIQALIIRIDSGGGSAFASEVIRQEMLTIRERGKKIYISMGSVAASGGYWISSAADEIWASPFTITGSIGVFGLFPTLDEGLNKLGVYTDGVGTHALAGAMRPDRPLNPEAAQIAQQSVESIYQRFLVLVSTARKRPVDEIDAIGQGRVWTGARAQALGLIDKLGYLNDVVKAVAQTHQIQTPQLKLIERDLTAQEQLFRNLVEKSSLEILSSGVFGQWGSRFNTLLSSSAVLQLDAFEQAAKPQGFSLMAGCLECTAL